MSTFLDICRDVRSQAGISGNGPSNVTGQTGIYLDVVRWVKESYNEIQTMYENWNFLFTTSSFTIVPRYQDYPIRQADGIRNIVYSSMSLSDTDGIISPLKFVPYQVWRLRQAYSTSIGRPSEYTETPNGIVRFHPEADKLYKVTYDGFLLPDIMENSTDIPIFNRQYTNLINLKALMRYSEYYNSPEVYESASAAFNDDIKKLEIAELPRHSFRTIPFA